MKRIAAPMAGGVTSFVLELFVYPVIFTVWKAWREVKPAMARAESAPAGGG